MKELNLVPLRPNRPPAFDEAQNRRQKARAAGMNPDYWYAVEWDKDVKRGEVKIDSLVAPQQREGKNGK